MTNILIIGAGGFIGSNLTRSLINKNDNVSIIIKDSSDEWRLKDLEHSYKKYFADLTNSRKLYDGIFNLQPDIIVNCATYGVYPKQKDPEKIFQNNVIGTENLIDVIQDYNKVKKIINIGSYLEILDKNKIKTQSWENYANAKSKQTELIHEFGNKSGVPISTLRLFNPYGKFESPGRLVCDVMIALIKKKKLEIFSKSAKHNFYHINDVTDTIQNLIINSKTDNKIFNLKTSDEISVESVVNTASRIADTELDIVWKDEDQRETQGGYIDSKDEILNPKISLEDGLNETFTWFEKNIDLYRKYGV